MELRFGKWKGFTTADVDDDYLSWLLSKPDISTKIQQAAQAELNRRRKIPLDKRSLLALKK